MVMELEMAWSRAEIGSWRLTTNQSARMSIEFEQDNQFWEDMFVLKQKVILRLRKKINSVQDSLFAALVVS